MQVQVQVVLSDTASCMLYSKQETRLNFQIHIHMPTAISVVFLILRLSVIDFSHGGIGIQPQWIYWP